MEEVQDPLLRVRGLSKSFGNVEVLHDIDLEAHGGSVLALLGENGAGKSTLVKILSGEYSPSMGVLTLQGMDYSELTPRQSRAAGIRVIAQEFHNAGSLTVAENIFLGAWPTSRGIVQHEVMRRKAQELLVDLGIILNVDASVESLSVAEKQLVEIARALAFEAKLLVLDEPTAALSHEEAQLLFEHLRSLSGLGVGMIYITHRLDEVFELADRLCILRDGRVTGAGPTTEFNRQRIIAAMLGSTERLESDRIRVEPGEVAIEITEGSASPYFQGIDIRAHHGEIVALYGQVGSGANECVEAMFGLRPLDGGEILVKKKAPDKRLRRSVARRIGFVPADRKSEGLIGERPARENVAITSWKRLATWGIWIRVGTESKVFRRWGDSLGIRPNHPGLPVVSLSGGNQQKVVLSRWLEHDCEVLLMVEPTRGVDVGARADIYDALRDMAASGACVLFATSDHEEVTLVADRAYVFSRGRLRAEIERSGIHSEVLLELAGSAA